MASKFGESDVSVPAMVNTKFVYTYDSHLHIEKKYLDYNIHGDFTVQDEQGQCVYKGQRMLKSEGFVLYDTLDKPLLCCTKVASRTSFRWTVYRGGEALESNVLFRVKYSERTREIKIFLPMNEDSNNPDFSIKKKSIWSRDCQVLYRNQQFSEMESEKFRWFKRSRLVIYVPAGVDQAFMATILALKETERMAHDMEHDAHAHAHQMHHDAHAHALHTHHAHVAQANMMSMNC